jgi:hypothetical protein
VAPNLYLVFSKPPDGMAAADYDRWYHEHVRENIETPGFLSGSRFALEQARGEGPGFSHLALYEYEGDYDPIRRGLEERIERRDIVLPDWFGQITFGAWRCAPVDERAVPARR